MVGWALRSLEVDVPVVAVVPASGSGPRAGFGAVWAALWAKLAASGADNETGQPDDGVDGVAVAKRPRDTRRFHSLANEDKEAPTLVARQKGLVLLWQEETIAGESQRYLSRTR